MTAVTAAVTAVTDPDPIALLEAARTALAAIEPRGMVDIEEVEPALRSVSGVLSGLQRAMDTITHPDVLHPDGLYSHAAGARESVDDQVAMLRDRVVQLRRAMRDARQEADRCVGVFADLRPRTARRLEYAEAMRAADEGHDVYALTTGTSAPLVENDLFYDDLGAACFDAHRIAEDSSVTTHVHVWRVVGGDAPAPDKPELRLCGRYADDSDL